MGEGRERLVEIAEGEVVLVKAEEVAQLMEVGGTHFLGKDFRITLGQIPEVIQVENDPRGRIRGVGIGLEAAGSLKQAEEVRFESLVQNGLIRHRLVKSYDRFRRGA